MNFNPRKGDTVEVNMTPLIDVVFLLLIFFMVTTTFDRFSQLRVDLPEASSSEPQEHTEQIELVIDVEGRYFLNGVEVINAQRETLYRALEEAVQGDLGRPLSIRADGRTSHQSVVTAMDVAGTLGLTRLSIATSEVEPSE